MAPCRGGHHRLAGNIDGTSLRARLLVDYEWLYGTESNGGESIWQMIVDMDKMKTLRKLIAAARVFRAVIWQAESVIWWRHSTNDKLRVKNLIIVDSEVVEKSV